MRVTLFLTIVLSFQVSAHVLGQKVSLDIRGQHLTKVLQEFRKQTGYAFVYKDNDVADVAPITLKIEDKELLEVLPMISAKTSIQFSVKDKVISISPKPLNNQLKNVSEDEVVIQQYIIRGKVQNDKDKPMANVSVVTFSKSARELPFRTQTNDAGDFTLTVKSDLEVGKIVFSHLGFKTLSLEVKSNMGTITLVEDHSDLDEVVVPISTGYQRIRPEQSTGAISQIGTKEFESRVSTNFLDGLVNRIPGLMINDNVQFTSTAPNGGTSSRPLFNIRGISTMSANQSPLIVVDGYPTELTLDMIDPNEIKSVTVLKDAAAATVYGVRASNGVIVIERKQAIQGKARFAFRATGSVTPEEKYSKYRWADNASEIVLNYQRDLLQKNVNADSWGQLANTAGGTVQRNPVYYILAQKAANMITQEQANRAFGELANYDNLKDYQRLFTRPAFTQTYNFNVSGGGANALYYVTANYKNKKGNTVGTNDGQFSLAARSTMRLSEKLALELTMDYQEQRNESRPVPGIGAYSHTSIMKM